MDAWGAQPALLFYYCDHKLVYRCMNSITNCTAPTPSSQVQTPVIPDPVPSQQLTKDSIAATSASMSDSATLDISTLSTSLFFAMIIILLVL